MKENKQNQELKLKKRKHYATFLCVAVVCLEEPLLSSAVFTELLEEAAEKGAAISCKLINAKLENGAMNCKSIVKMFERFSAVLGDRYDLYIYSLAENQDGVILTLKHSFLSHWPRYLNSDKYLAEDLADLFYDL